MLCKKCISSSIDYPTVFLDENGVCNLCTFYDRYRERLADFVSLRNAFDRRIEDIRKQGASNEYDCIVAFSGGKDSTYILYHMKQQYHLRILAVICDNYFMHPANLAKALEILSALGVDYMYIQPQHEGLRRFYAAAFTRTGSICLGCVAFIWASVLGIACERRIPGVIIGESRDQMFRGSYYHMLKAASPHDLTNLLNLGCKGFYWEKYYLPTFDLVRTHINMYLPGDTLVETTLTLSRDRTHTGHVPDIVPFFFFHPHDEFEIVRTLETNLGWKDLSGGKPLSHPDCVFHAIAYPSEVQNLIGHCVREGVMSRTSALADIRSKIEEWISMDDRTIIADVCKVLGLNMNDIEKQRWYNARARLRRALIEVQRQQELHRPHVDAAGTLSDAMFGALKMRAARTVRELLYEAKSGLDRVPRAKAFLKGILPSRLQSYGRRESNERLVQRYKELLSEHYL